jgi:hypothetical protein
VYVRPVAFYLHREVSFVAICPFRSCTCRTEESLVVKAPSLNNFQNAAATFHANFGEVTCSSPIFYCSLCSFPVTRTIDWVDGDGGEAVFGSSAAAVA